MNTTTTDQPIVTPHTDQREFLHSYRAAAFLPLLQSTITAIIVGVMVYVLAANLTGTFYPEKPAIVCAVLAWGISWLFLHRHWFTLTNIETYFQVDLNNDDHIGAPPPAPQHVTRIQLDDVDDGHYKQTKIFDLPVSDQQLQTLAAGLLNGQPFSERRWAGDGKPFTSNNFRALRSDMLKRGLLELVSEKDSRQGYQLSRAGRGVMKHYATASATASPSPLEDEA